MAVSSPSATVPDRDRPFPRVRPVAAARAMANLLRNPQDTSQVFLLTEALRGRSGLDIYLRFIGSPMGQQIIAEDRSLLDALSDHERLAALPEGSFGRRYLEFMTSENLSAEALVEVSRENIQRLAARGNDVKIFATRMRDMHDLYHVLAGYGRDELGEICVLAFSYPQQKIRSFAVIASFGALRVRQDLRRSGFRAPGVLAAVRQAYRDGGRAAWLPGEDLEGMLAEDLSLLRKRLNIPPPTKYKSVLATIRQQSGTKGGSLSDLVKQRIGR